MERLDLLVRDLAEGRTRRLARLFFAASLRPPIIVWQPDANVLGDPRLKQMLDRWQASRLAGGLPSPGFADEELAGPLVDRVSVIDLAEDGRNPVYRHVGRSITRRLGINPAGRAVLATELSSRDFLCATYLAVACRAEPLYTEHEPDRLMLVSQWKRLLLPCAGPDGRVRTLVGMAIAEDPLRTLVDTVSDGMLVIDEAQRIRIANPAAERLFGLEEETLLGKPAGEILAWAGHTPGSPLPDALLSRSVEAVGRRVDGSEFPVEVSIGATPIAGARLFVAVLRDISERKASEAEMRRLAYHDPLTGVANRALFLERLDQALARARRDRTRVGLIMLDLDEFKLVNDRYGHATGDALLVGFARRVGTIVRETDLMARLGGDEFAILLTGLRDNAGAAAFAGRVLARLSAPLLAGERGHKVSASLGIALSQHGATPADELQQLADKALYRAKADGGGCFRLGHAGGEPRRLSLISPTG